MIGLIDVLVPVNTSSLYDYCINEFLTNEKSRILLFRNLRER